MSKLLGIKDVGKIPLIDKLTVGDTVGTQFLVPLLFILSEWNFADMIHIKGFVIVIPWVVRLYVDYITYRWTGMV